MKKLLLAGILFVSADCFSSLPDLTKTLKDLAKFPVLVHFVKQADEAQNPEIKNYIGTHLFGSEWETTHLPVAQEVVARNLIGESVAEHLGLVEQIIILEIMQKAKTECRLDVEAFMITHPKQVILDFHSSSLIGTNSNLSRLRRVSVQEELDHRLARDVQIRKLDTLLKSQLNLNDE